MEDPNEAYAVRAYRRNKDLEERIRALEAERLIYFQANADVARINCDYLERIRALEAELAESTRHRDQNRETAVALQMRVSALEVALRKHGHRIG